jgi:signal peptidase I
MRFSLATKSRWRLDLSGIVIMAIVLAFLIRFFMFDLIIISGSSMEPAVTTGTVALVVRCAYGIPNPFGGMFVVWKMPEPGHIVLVQTQPQDRRKVVKRVFEIGPAFLRTEAGKLHGRGGVVSLSSADAVRFAGSVYLRPGFAFLVGDNQDVSIDSRAYGPIPIEMIGGRVIVYQWKNTENQ